MPNNDVYEHLVKYNPTKKRKVLVFFNDMIAFMEANKKLKRIVAELFMKERKLNISLVFISQSYFKVPKDKRPDVTLFHHKNT